MVATEIEQSKYLLELGLDPKTADMCFEMNKGNWTLTVGKKSAQVNRGLVIPAWSLDALLEVIKKDKPELVCDGDKWYCGTTEYDTGYYSNKLDAAYEMVCWTLKTRTD